jgi:BirA family biotin operon repressor/biotin-[acetyl-CoA-carboxylase] ligase
MNRNMTEQRPDTTSSLLELLSAGGFVSGEAIARELSVSRAAVWKLVEALREEGYDVDAVRGKGYRWRNAHAPLDVARITAAMRNADRLERGAPRLLSSVASTNTHLRESVTPGSPPRAVFAERQTSGRGRWGRQWVSPPAGGIYLSIDWPFERLPDGPSGLSLAVGVHIAEALQSFGFRNVGLKWPNDLLVGGAKLGGILLELSGEPTGPCRIVIGVGINWSVPNSLRGQLDREAVGLSDLAAGESLDRNAIAALVLDAVMDACLTFPSHRDEVLGTRWQRLDALAGQPITLELPGGDVEGVVVGVDGTGALLLDTADGLQRYVSGDTHLRVRR